MHGTPPAPNPEELARKLFACEDRAQYSAEELTIAAVRTYEQLRTHLAIFLGPAGFDALWARSIHLVRQVLPWDELPALSPAPFAPHHLAAAAQGCDPAEAYTVLLAIFTQFLGTLFTFIGAELGFRLLQQHWPGVSLPTRDDHDQEAHQ